MMLVPEAWQDTPDMDPDKVAFYQWAACVMEPWDGPALFMFANGCYCGANFDRNGLRPCRWITTTKKFIICASEVGAISIPPDLGSSIQVSLAECLDDFWISEDPKLLAFGYTFEQLDLLMRPMVTNGKEALGSMIIIMCNFSNNQP
ncbi:nucleophile aminohydrolase [Phakopsora pachyrhizi]|nr:nucleophile aminohydrolase [Phakopsora pachyrhizi]